jgi:hypothetical protein
MAERRRRRYLENLRRGLPARPAAPSVVGGAGWNRRVAPGAHSARCVLRRETASFHGGPHARDLWRPGKGRLTLRVPRRAGSTA